MAHSYELTEVPKFLWNGKEWEKTKAIESLGNHLSSYYDQSKTAEECGIFQLFW